MASRAEAPLREIPAAIREQAEASIHESQNKYDLTWSGCALGVFLAIPLAIWLAWNLDGWGFFGKLLGMWVIVALAVAVVCGLTSDHYIRKAAARFNEWFPVQSADRAAAVAALNDMVFPMSQQGTKNAFAEEVMKKLGETPNAAAVPPEVAMRQQLSAAGPVETPTAVSLPLNKGETQRGSAPPQAFPYIPLEPDRPKSEPKTQKGGRQS